RRCFQWRAAVIVAETAARCGMLPQRVQQRCGPALVGSPGGCALGRATLTEPVSAGWKKSAAGRSDDGPGFAGRARTSPQRLRRGCERIRPATRLLGLNLDLVLDGGHALRIARDLHGLVDFRLALRIAAQG